MPRENNYFKRRRERLMQIDPHCHWCGIEVIYYALPEGKQMPDNFATIDHLYSRLNEQRKEKTFAYGHEMTLVLACHKCNHERNVEEMQAVPIQMLWDKSDSRPFSQKHPIRFICMKLLGLSIQYTDKKRLRKLHGWKRRKARLTNWLLRTKSYPTITPVAEKRKPTEIVEARKPQTTYQYAQKPQSMP